MGAQLGILTEDACEEIHLATLEVLERTGVWVEADDALDVYADAGCEVDREHRIVRIPPYVVDEAIRKAPATQTCGARNPENDMVLSGRRVTFTNFSTGVNVNDIETGERRASTSQDVHDIGVLVDWADQIDFYFAAVTANEAPAETQGLHGYAAALSSTSKPVWPALETVAEFEAAYQIAALVAGGEDAVRERQFISSGGCTVSPLRLPKTMTDVTMWGARKGLATGALCMTMAGGSGPATMAGTIVVGNAELLAALVLVQAVQPGLSYLYSTSGTFMDMRYGVCPVGSPEAAFMNTGIAALARYYMLPSWVAGL